MTNIRILAGNLTADPVLQFTRAGKPYVSFTVADTPRRRNAQTEQWEDGETTFQRCEAYVAAENIADSVGKGARVIVIGRIRTDRFTPRGSERQVSVDKLIVEEIGVSLRWSTAKPVRTQRTGAGQAPQAGQAVDPNDADYVPSDDELYEDDAEDETA